MAAAVLMVMHKGLRAIDGGSGASRLAMLAKTLPGQMRAAAHALVLAERRLAGILTMRATGQEVKRSELATARVALARTQRDADDLRRIYDALPDPLKQAREATGT